MAAGNEEQSPPRCIIALSDDACKPAAARKSAWADDSAPARAPWFMSVNWRTDGQPGLCAPWQCSTPEAA